MRVYAWSVTGANVRVTMISHDFPSSVISFGGFEANPFGLIVERIRRAVQDPPLGRRAVSRDAELDLERYLPGLLGHVAEQLDDLRRTGHDHLCFVPHG